MAVRIVLRHLSGSLAGQTDSFEVERVFELTAGRDASCAVRYDPESDDLVSRRHLRIAGAADAFTLTDLGSRNGTFVNRQRVFAPVRLNSGDVVQLGTGGPEFRFEIAPVGRPSEAAVGPSAAASAARSPGVQHKAFPTRAIALSLLAVALFGAAAAGLWFYRVRVAEWAGAAWAARLPLQRWAASLIPRKPPPPKPSKWALAEPSTGQLLFEVRAPNATPEGRPAVDRAPADLPVFVRLPDGRILPLLTEAAGGAARPVTVRSPGPAPPDWRSGWRWPRRDAAGWLLVLDASSAIVQKAPLSTAQFPAWKPARGAFVIDTPFDPQSASLAGRVEPVGGKRVA